MSVLVGVLALGPSSIDVFVGRLRAAEAYWAARPFQVTVLHTLLATGMPARVAWPLFGLLVVGALAAGIVGIVRTKGDAIASLAACAALSQFIVPFMFAQDYTLMLLALPWVVMQALRHPQWAALFCVSIYVGGVSWIRYPVSHDALHALMPLFLFPAAWMVGQTLGVARRRVAVSLGLWLGLDLLFGIGNPTAVLA